jgi:hypothetical protein
MTRISTLCLVAPILCSVQQKYQRLTSALVPDQVFCGSDGTKVFAWDFKQDKIVRVVGPGQAPVVTKVLSFGRGTPGSAEVAFEGVSPLKSSSKLEDCTGDLQFYYDQFRPTKLCGAGGISARFYQGLRQGVFEILQNNKKVMTIAVKIDPRTGYTVLNGADVAKEASALDFDGKSIDIKGQGLVGYSIQPRIGALRFCK